MPPAVACGGVGVEEGEGEAFGGGRGVVPVKFGGDVCAVAAHFVVGLFEAHGLAFCEYGAGELECGWGVGVSYEDREQ